MNRKVISTLLVVVGILYFVCPVDAAVGPIDDLIVMIATAIASAKIGNKKIETQTVTE